ncbi:MAG TPA: hypothetical protein VN327_15230 [Pseudonocardiaceae bacterium]|jgi:hypothetical protein|nr:hypothetical protein [Pseudonocardiaceae bacterium]
MSDVAFIVLTIAVFAVLALAVRGVERLVGQTQGNEPAVPVGRGVGTERPGDYGRVVTSGVATSGVGAHADGQVAR